MPDKTSHGGEPKLGKKSFITPARPGRHNSDVKSAGASSVESANGKIAKPGFHQKSPNVSSTRGSIARPGGAQDMNP